VIAGTLLLSLGSVLFAVYFKIFNSDSPEFRIFYLLDFLLKNNVTLSESLSQCIINMSRTKYGTALVKIKKELSQGIDFSAAFGKIKFFSSYVRGWLSIADTHGNLAEICGSIGNYYAGKDDKLRETAAKLIEPAVIILIGLYVLIIMLTVILPILTHAGGIL
jgi:type II secretory pathway component PulF